MKEPNEIIKSEMRKLEKWVFNVLEKHNSDIFSRERQKN